MSTDPIHGRAVPTAKTHAPGRRAPHSRWHVALPAALLLLALGLPWSTSTAWHSTFHPGRFFPGPCSITQIAADYQVFSCIPVVQTDGWLESTPQTRPVHGAQHGGRFGVVAGLVLLAIGWHTRRPRHLLLAGVVVAVGTVLTAGLGFASAGSSAVWIAAACLASGGLLGRRPAKDSTLD